VEDAGLLQHGSLLDAEERRVVLCGDSEQASKRSVGRSNANGHGRGGDPGRIAPDLGPGGRKSERARARGAGAERGGRRGAPRTHLPRRGRRPSSRRAAVPWLRVAVGVTRRECARASGQRRGGGSLAGFGLKEHGTERGFARVAKRI
jgi:hypothetical protein